MNLQARDEGGVRIVTVGEDRLDAAAAIAFKDRFHELVADAPSRIVLDLGPVAFLDSSGLGAIVAVMKMLAPERTLVLSSLSPLVEKVFRLTRLDSVFTIFDSVEAAVAEARHVA